MAESLEGWAAQHRRPRPRQHRDRTRGLVLGLSLLLFTVVLGLSAVFLNRAAADSPDDVDGPAQNANLVSGCYLMYPDDSVQLEDCLTTHVP